jgi:hypothetical protein
VLGGRTRLSLRVTTLHITTSIYVLARCVSVEAGAEKLTRYRGCLIPSGSHRCRDLGVGRAYWTVVRGCSNVGYFGQRMEQLMSANSGVSAR